MSAKKTSSPARAAAPATVVPREIISTCQIKTSAGTPVTWTAYRRVDAPHAARPDFYVSTLPDNTDDPTPSEYELNAIAAQAKAMTITLTVLDRDVVYFVTPPGGTPERVPVARGEAFTVPARGTGTDITKVTLTFEGDYCTLQAIPNPLGSTETTEATEGSEATEEPVAMELTDDDVGPPPPLPNNED